MDNAGPTSGKSLRVAYDHRIFVHQKYGGISRYFARISEYMPQFGITPRIIAPFYQSEYLNDLPRGMVWGRQFNVATQPLRPRVILDEAIARPLAAAFRADIVHESYHHFRRVAPRSARIVTTVHDFIHELFPGTGQEGLTRCLDGQLARADRIICVSDSTRRDLARFYPQFEHKAVVVLHGFDADAGRATGPETPPHPKPYILYVGMRWRGYKNFEGLLAAYAGSARLRDLFDIVAVGGGAFTDEERGSIATKSLEGKVHQRNASDAELWTFYRGAALFVFPSLYEGFGIPPLEAMAADCPVVTMNVSAMPEVCGDAAEYAEPDDPASLTRAMENVLLSPGRADALRVAGRQQTRRFSWRECARQTAEVYHSLD